MDVREALATILEERWDGIGELPDFLAPIIERALRAEREVAYKQGFHDGTTGIIRPSPKTVAHFVNQPLTAGVAAMVEEK